MEFQISTSIHYRERDEGRPTKRILIDLPTFGLIYETYKHIYIYAGTHTQTYTDAATAKFIKVHHPALSFVASALVFFLCNTLWPDFAEL